jgi:ketosteroid isomerase-like protein
MSEQQNFALVQEFYAALKRGDATDLLNTLADNVRWFVPGPKDIIPLAGQREGVGQVAQTLARLLEMQDAEQFDVREFVAQGDKVIALGHYRFRIKSNGEFYESDWAHAFGIRDGKISSFQEYVDRTLGLPHIIGFKPVLVSEAQLITGQEERALRAVALVVMRDAATWPIDI